MTQNMTTIKVKRNTRRKLEHYKIVKSESMDDLINRLLTAGGSISKDGKALSGEQT